MTNLKTTSLFPRSSFVGFDHLFNGLDNFAKHASDTYPPHNIVKLSDDEYLIEIAVAGFENTSKKEEVSVSQEQNTLFVTGSKLDGEEGREYLHKGISTKGFQKTFKLSDHVNVDKAKLRDGILTINLKYELPEEKKPRYIPID